MTHTGAPPPTPPTGSADRARNIAERARTDKQGAIPNVSHTQKTNIKRDGNIPARTEKLPPDLVSRDTPRKIEGTVTEINNCIARIQTSAGEINVKIPAETKLQPRERVVVEIPPQSKAGDTVIIQRIQSEAVSTPSLPPPERPPLKAGDIVVATAPQYTPPSTSHHTTYVSSQQIKNTALPAKVRLTGLMPLTSENNGNNGTPPPTGYLERFTLQGLSLPEGLKANIQTPVYNSAPVLAALNIDSEDDNVLTQSRIQPPYSPAVTSSETPEGKTLSSTSFLTAALETFATNTLSNAAPSGQKKAIPAQANPLPAFFKVDVIGLLPPNTDPATAQKNIGEWMQSVSVSAPSAISEKPDNPAARFLQLRTETMPGNTPPQNLKPDSGAQNNTDPNQIQPILAKVIGTGQSGQTVVTFNNPQSQPQLLTIQTPVKVSPNTQIFMTMAPVTPETLQTMPDIMNALPDSLQTQISGEASVASAIVNRGDLVTSLPAGTIVPGAPQPWPALQESLEVLNQNMPQAAQAIQNSLPSPTPRMVSTALFFLAALKAGGLDNWLGDKSLDALKAFDKKGLLEKLRGDFNQMSRNTETATGQWKNIPLPMLHDGQINMLQFFVKHEKLDTDEGETNATGDKKTRFLLDLELSNVGPMQLDGYLTPATLDIILRTDHRMAEDARRNLMQKFAGALETVNLKGGITFQNGTKDWVRITPDMAQDPSAGVYI